MEFKSLPGFRDFYPEDCAIRNYIFGQWRNVSHRYGFKEWDAPVLEPLELFTEKSGEEIVSQLFNFEDKGGRKVSLRPEMTPSLARLIGAKAGSLKRPIKWFGIGENYRYEKQQRGRLRAFYQFNADIFGEIGVSADAEIIALCVSTLMSFGFSSNDFCIRLSDRTLWFLFLENIGVPSEEIAVKVLSVVDKIERVSGADLLEMMKNALQGTTLDASLILEKVRQFVEIKNLNELKVFLGSSNEKILERLIAWESILSLLTAFSVKDFIRIDFKIVRGLAYYTGFVFEAFQLVGEGRALAGGGRYDNLVSKLGGENMPAVGFGMGDVTLRNLMEQKNILPTLVNAPDAYIIVLGEENRSEALKDVAMLREYGFSIDYNFKEGKFGKLIQAAEQTGARYALVYGTNELASGLIKIRDTAERREIAFRRDELSFVLREILENGLPVIEECHGDGHCSDCTCGSKK